jgi:hypothetical protein
VLDKLSEIVVAPIRDALVQLRSAIETKVEDLGDIPF